MKKTIFVLCLITVISATGAVLQRQEPPPTQMQKTELVNTEKKEFMPQTEPIAHTAATTPPQVETAAVEPTTAPVEQITSPTQSTEKPQSTNTPKATSKTTAQPRNGETRVLDGQPQTYILGFGWVDGIAGPSVGEKSYGKGDWNKMVGDTGIPASKPTYMPPEPIEGEIVQELLPTPSKDSTPPDYKPETTPPQGGGTQSQLDPEHASFDNIIGH